MNKAFTLIELLVVIAIIAILAAILFPVFAQAKVAAKATVILSNQKQQLLGEIMYMTDSDDTEPSFITRINGQPNGVPTRPDCLSWVQQVQPYVKNGNPVYPGGTATEVQPQGIFFSPMFTEANWVAAADQPDCDGAGALDSWVPVTWYHAHFGLAFAVNNEGVDPNAFGPADTTAGTPSNPIYFFAGSYLPYHTATTVANNLAQQISGIARPAETALITDGFTGVISSGQNYAFGVTCGCESASMYKGGGNVAFTEGHVKFVKGNNQRYLSQDASGNYFMKYFTIDR